MQNKKYIDRWGDIWERISYRRVRRIKDGNIGGWFLGKGLDEIIK